MWRQLSLMVTSNNLAGQSNLLEEPFTEAHQGLYLLLAWNFNFESGGQITKFLSHLGFLMRRIKEESLVHLRAKLELNISLPCEMFS